MIKQLSPGVSMPTKKYTQRLGPLSEEELARRQLMRDVMSRLDYNDVKRSLKHDRRFLNDAIMAHGNGSKRSAVTPAADVILPKIEGILMEFKARESNDTVMMRQIDLSLAELAATMAKSSADSALSQDAAVIIDLSGKAKTR